MGKEIHGLITFKSTHHTIQGESFFRDKDIAFKTIPTPREITRSCGLAIKFDLEDINKVKEIIKTDEMIIDSVYKYIKDEKGNKVEKII